MKKLILIGSFVLVLLFSLFITYTIRVVTLPNEEIEFKTIKKKLSDTEVEMYNRSGQFEKQILPAEEGYRNYLINEIKITRKKMGSGGRLKLTP
jgi:hypothetical protein